MTMVIPGPPNPPPSPYWPWCAQPGASRTNEAKIDTNAYGDGYVHRSTRGINPIRASWTLTFPIVGQSDIDKYHNFLYANCVEGFWWNPPDWPTVYVFVMIDSWSLNISDKNRKIGLIGQLQATFVQCFNPQPV